MPIKSVTRGELRDSMRRQLGVSPPTDTIPTALAGEEPRGQPNPTNVQCNQAIYDAISYLNLEAEFRSTEIDRAVPAGVSAGNGGVPGSTGPAIVYLTQNNQLPLIGTITEVRRAAWFDGVNITVLQWTSRQVLDRDDYNYSMVGTGTPRYCWIEGDSLFLSPAPTTAGTLQLFCGTSLYQFLSDTDTIDQLPADLNGAIIDTACWKVCLTNRDPKLRELAPGFQTLVTWWIPKLKAWANSRVGADQPYLAFQGYQTHRIRR